MAVSGCSQLAEKSFFSSSSQRFCRGELASQSEVMPGGVEKDRKGIWEF
jgi:hypothetical protein